MKKVSINVEQCENGMKMAESIYNDYGAVIVAEDTILDQHIIRKLYNLSIPKIKIYLNTQDTFVTNDSEEFRAQYNENVEVMKDMLHEISIGKNLDIQKVNHISESVFSRINENRDIVGCLNQMKDVDEYTYTHSVNVSLLCMLIGKWMKYDPKRIKDLVQAGLLHDIGKSRVPMMILNKPGKLTQEEFDEMKKHPIYGYRAIEKIPGISKDVCMGVLMHHERDDGSGYPMNAKGSQINEFAKILAVADIYDAMTSQRIYKERQSPFEVFELMEEKAFGILDPRVMNVFLENIAAYYIGDFVSLNTGEVGEIIYINPRHISKPIIRVDNSYLDLSFEAEIKILELI